jgi:cytochrome c oxidase assembly factor CtaG
MKRLAVVLPIIGLAGIVVSTVAWIIAELTSVSVAGPISVALAMLSFVGPVLLVLGLHMLMWRVLVRPLARMESRQRTGTIIGVGALLALLSVPIVAGLLFVGFAMLSPILDAVSQ